MKDTEHFIFIAALAVCAFVAVNSAVKLVQKAFQRPSQTNSIDAQKMRRQQEERMSDVRRQQRLQMERMKQRIKDGRR